MPAAHVSCGAAGGLAPDGVAPVFGELLYAGYEADSLGETIKIAACRRLSKADCVRRLEAYRWSSYPGYVAKRNAQEFGIAMTELKQHGRRAGPAKAVELACRMTGQSGRVVGMHYGGISGATVGNLRREVCG